MICIESLFSENQVVKLVDIQAIHKSKPTLLGTSTGGRIELRNGSTVELSGLIRRRETFQAIVDAAHLLKHSIPIYRDGGI